MATLPVIYPDGDANIVTSDIIKVGGDGTTYFSCINQDPTTGQPDASYVANNNTAAGANHFTLQSFPTDTLTVDTLTARLHVVPVGRVDDSIELRVGVYAADQTTLLAGNANGLQGATVGTTNPSGAFNVTLTLTATGAAANRATWDAAVLRVNWIYTQSMSKDTYTLRLHAIRLEGTYTQAVTRTGTAGSLLKAFSQTATGLYAPNRTGTSSQSLKPFTQSAAGTSQRPTFTGTSTQTLRAFTQSVTGTFVDPVWSGGVNSVLPSLQQSSTGFFAPDRTGTASSPLKAFVSAASGSFVRLVSDWSNVATATTLAGTSTFTGTGASTLPKFSSATSGTFVANVAPVAVGIAMPSMVFNDTTIITLDATSSYDLDGTIASYQWELVSGPTTGTFDTPNAATATFTPTESYAAEVLADAPVAYWRMEETSGTTLTDASGNGWNGLYNGAVTQGATGIQGNGVSFPDADTAYVGIPGGTLGLPTATSEFTIECWFKTTSGDLPLVTLRDSTNDQPVCNLHVGFNGVAGAATGHISIIVRGTGGTGLASTVLSGSGVVNDDVWHHVVWTRNSAKQHQVVLDGVDYGVVMTDTLSATTITGNMAGIGIERRWVQSAVNPASRTGTGTIDEVAVYNTALSSARIVAHYEAGA